MAFTAFVLGISLLIYTAAAVVILAVASAGSAVIPWKDVFWTDYQTTDSFRSYLSDRLSVLVRSAADPEGADPMTPEDTNLLYVVTADGEVRFANTIVKLSNEASLPEGYNFLLYFDGSEVIARRGGQNVSDQFFTPLLEEGAPEITVALAAAEHPTEYLSGDYDSFSYLLDDLRQIRAFVIWLLIVPALAGVAFTVWSIVWHRYKVRADQAIAWFTGRVWLEIKLLLLIPFLWVCALAFMCLLAVVTNQVLTYGVLRYASVPMALWWFYLYVNDIRYNFGHIAGRSLCAGLAGLLRRQLLRHPAAQRAERRMIWQFAACLPFFLFCVMSVPYLYERWLYIGWWPVLLALVCAAGVGLIALQVWLIRENKQSAAELDDLLGRIEAAGAGRLEGAPPLPEESDFHDAAEQLSHMEAGLRTALDERMRSERMKVELITNVSHDLKTPLTSIISYAELLKQEDDLPEAARDYVHILSDKAKRLQTMVQDVFEVSKATTGNLRVDVKPLDFAKLLRQTLADMAEDIEDSGLALKPRLPDAPVWIAADGDRLYRVFQNLIGNALKYSLPGSRVYLDLTVEGLQATAMVRNTSREELPDGVDLTERFVRGDESRTDGGSGLGLSIARTFTEACGGAFSVQTQADLFTAAVSFPLTMERPPQEETI